MSILFSITTFLSAFLLMMIQPIFAKKLLPWFGSAPTAWLSVIWFFQGALFFGYLYAYMLNRLKNPWHQSIVHSGLMLACCAFIPIEPHVFNNLDNLWQPVAILTVLSASILLPTLLICSSSPLLQSWYARQHQGDLPYRYYAVSNLGSLLGIFAFPLFLEPLFGLTRLFSVWSGLFVVLLLCLTGCMVLSFPKTYGKTKPAEVSVPVSKENHPTLQRFGFWILLSFLSSALLLGTTQIMLQNVLSFPLLWIIPLALYLISFICIFGWPKTGYRPLWLMVFTLVAAIVLSLPSHHHLTLIHQLIVYSVLLFSGCMICHDALNQSKPAPAYLTQFYLAIAFGGMIGGLFVDLIAPLIFIEWWDFYVPVLLILSFAGFQYLNQQFSDLTRTIAMGSWTLVSFAFMGILAFHYLQMDEGVIYQHRNFYGRCEITEIKDPDGVIQRTLRHGAIMHGQQFLTPGKRQQPSSYFSLQSGVGMAVHYLRQQHPEKAIKVGVVGLGTGTIAALMAPNESLHFYECDPDIVKIAQEKFTYLRECPANIDVILGDGRLSLQKAYDQQQLGHYDLLAIDAFNGDAIPMQLITLEAIKLYLAHLDNNGIVAFHISSRYLDLYPTLQAAAKVANVYAFLTHNSSNYKKGISSSEWVLLSRDPNLGVYLYQNNALFFRQERQDAPWTDDFSYILSAIKWHM